MATTKDDIKTSYPLPTYQFHVAVDGMDPIAFSEISGLSIERETITYKDGMSFREGAKHMPGQKNPVSITLKKGVVQGDSKLYGWIQSISGTTIDKKDIVISLMDETGENPVVSWKVTNAFPKKLEAPAFNATSKDVAIESLEMMADDLKLEFH